MANLQYVLHKGNKNTGSLKFVQPEAMQAVLEFHSGIAGYAQTPLASLPNLAKQLGVGQIFVKDESARFGLNAFKALGGSYAIARYLCGKLNIPVDGNSFNVLCSEEARAKLGTVTFVTATDGNHGRGVAWAAKLLGHKAVVYLPEGSSQERLNNIRALGAEAEITKFNYDGAVRLAYAMSPGYRVERLRRNTHLDYAGLYHHGAGNYSSAKRHNADAFVFAGRCRQHGRRGARLFCSALAE